MRRLFGIGRVAAAAAALAGLAGCMSSSAPQSGGGGMGDTLRNLMRYGSSAEPPVAEDGDVEARDCPGVTVAEGRSAIRAGGEGAAIRSQVVIANLARECLQRPDGTIVVKVGVEGRALLGPGGASGRFDVPVSFTLKRGDKVLSSRTRRTAVTVPPGQAQTTFIIVERDLLVPPGTGEFDIEVGLGGGVAAERPAQRRRAGG